MNKRLLSDAEAEMILGGCDEIDKASVNYAESDDNYLTEDCTKLRKSILQFRSIGCYPSYAITSPGCDRILQ